MSQTFDIRHVTTYHYAAPMSFARCNLRLRPIAWDGQTLISHKLITEPGGTIGTAAARGGLFTLDRLLVSRAVQTLAIISEARVSVARDVPPLLPSDLTIAEVAARARRSLDITNQSPARFLYPSLMIDQDGDIAAWARPTLHPDRPALAAALDLAQLIARTFRFDPDATKTETLPAQAFAARAGVCQDFAHIMISALRAAGLPAAYASGYIRTIPPPGQERLQGADAMHGWVLLWSGDPDTMGGRGWIGLDPTNGILMASDHILVAAGRDYQDIAPIDGVFTGSGAQDVQVEVDVVPVGAS
ncbi:MAG: transglutaminase domain-containing protein [Sphingomonadaceae bacterium]